VRDYESFLPNLKRTDAKFDIKVYVGAPPSETMLNLFELPEDVKKSAINGLEKWNRYFNFTLTEDISEADIKIFAESGVLIVLKQNGRALMPGHWKTHELWSEYAQDEESLGYTILLNQSYISKAKSNPSYAKFVIAHEFGHFIGLEHPDAAFYFSIKKVGGISDPSKYDHELIGRLLNEQAQLYPQFENLSIMLANGAFAMGERYLGDLDYRATEIILGLYNEKYSQPKTNWREAMNTASPEANRR
jgi:hypothetical protein